MAEVSEPTSQMDTDDGRDFISNILTPGSSMHPTFLLILDIAFASLLFVLLGMLVLTKGSIHVFALIAIEGCLWASVKWFVHELQNVPNITQSQEKPETKKDGIKEE
ncbi:hypothetical protein QCA50_001279 [Cerrena zonata]|uniref:Uncharacterized protein n=1 Tax=Cerrena zonata TaxID=2478898 RepID=A0AAW0GSU0_9APHY